MERRTPSRTFLLLLGATVSVGGCASMPGFLRSLTGGARPIANGASPRAHDTPSTTGGVQVVYLAFDLVSAEFVVDGVRHSRKVWNHVDERRIEPDVSARLARNGLRVGVASADAWPILRAIFDAAEADVQRWQVVAQGTDPLTLPMAPIRPGESIFTYGRGGRLVGKTFDRGDKLVIVDYSFHPEQGPATELLLSFEVRSVRDELTWQKRGHRIEQRVAVDIHVFDQLEVGVSIRANEFLVLGVTDLVGNEYLVGGRFLSSSRAGVRREKLFCITPVPIQASSR